VAMRLYFFETGVLRCDKSLITMGRGLGTKFEVPVPFFLIQHPKGNLLYDTGNAKELAVDARKHWGAVVDAYEPIMSRDQYCVENLLKIGVKAEDINYIVMSHLHLDHAGGVKDFPNAQIFVQRSEMEWAYTCDFYQKGAYIKADFDYPLNYHFIEGWRENPYDLFGDGSVTIWFTPGHTPGHQTMLVDLPKSGKFLLTGDACYTTEILNEDVLPGLVWNCQETVKSIKKIRHIREALGATIVTGHDPDSWKAFKKAPEYYE